MRSFAIAQLAGLAAALPAVIDLDPQSRSIEARQLYSSDELLDGGPCPETIFIYARGSTESGNLGTLGGDVGDGLEDEFGDDAIWVQGVGGDYDAAIGDNVLPDGTSRAAIREMTGLFELADSTCPEAKIVAGGYSQGAALTAATIRDLDPAITEKIVGVILFGYTKNEQNDGEIPNYPADRLLVFCAVGDLVCEGQLVVTAAHLTYGDEAADEAPEFLIQRINSS